MIYIESNSTDPYYNFALEDYLMSANLFPDDIIFMFWRTQPTVMVGNFQNTLSEINEAYVKEKGIMVVRRLSGGGTIYTDMGGWQFSFIKREDNNKIGFEKFTQPVLEALAELGVDAVLSGRNDLTIDGKKFSGNAQFIKKGYTLHHGSLLFDTDIEEMVKSTTVDSYKIISKGIQSVRERVTNISDHLKEKISMLQFKEMMIDHILGEGQRHELGEEEIQTVKTIAERKFRNWEAIYGKSPKCSVVRKARFAGGTVEVRLEIEKGRICRLNIFGDFFGTFCPQTLEEVLKNCPYDRQSIFEKLKGCDTGEIYHISLDEIVQTIVD